LYKEDTIHGNIVWPQILTDWCMLNDIPLGHVSSGCIYEGRRSDGQPFTEEDEPNFSFKYNNSSFYSGTKTIAEQIVGKWEKSYIWRLRIPFEEFDNSRNYISKILKYERLLDAENSVSQQTRVRKRLYSNTKQKGSIWYLQRNQWWIYYHQRCNRKSLKIQLLKIKPSHL